jgi:hypothetical protein
MEVFGRLRCVAGDDDACFRETLDLELARCGLPGVGAAQTAPSGRTR